MHRWKHHFGSLAVSLALLIPAFGTEAQTAATELTPLRLGLIGIAPESPIRLGIKRGIFKEEGIDAKVTDMGAGADVVAGIIGGSFDIGTAGPVNVLFAAGRGLPVRIISALNQAPESDADVAHRASAIMVPENSTIKTAKDLAGKKLAVNALKSVGEIGIRNWMEKNGADPGSIRFVELRFPDMQATLKAGHVDAIWQPEPFVAMGTGSGLQIVGANVEALTPGATLTILVGTSSFLNKSPQVIEKFRRALAKSTAYANTHPEEVRQELQESTKLPPAIAGKVALPLWGTQTNVKGLSALNDRVVEMGLLKQKVDLKTLVGSSPTR